MLKLFRVAVTLFFLVTVGSQLSFSQNNSALMILIINPKYAGETGQMKGVARYLKDNIERQNESIEIKEVESEDLDKVLNILSSYKGNKKPLILGAGNTGIKVLKAIKSQFPSVLSIYLAHQLFNGYETLIKTSSNTNGVNLMILPKHVITPSFAASINNSETKLLEVIGVAHNITRQDLVKEYEEYKSEIPGIDTENYTVAILGGDAENPDGSWLYFTKEDALKLAKNIEKHLPQDGHLFVLNGPRTGKHNIDGSENKEAHRSEKLDPITEAFVDYFRYHKGLKVFNFIYGKHGMYKAVLGKLTDVKDATLWVPGESTSMISETIDTLGGDKKVKILVYEHSAMSKVHKSHVKSEHAVYRVRVVSSDGKMSELTESSEVSTASAAKSAADVIMKLFN
ncbi:MAG: hypothetical protein RLZZ59_363 [Pseudomonadota bacterium]